LSETPVEELSYTGASQELEEILELFEQREMDIDLLVPKLERAASIVEELDRRIRKALMRVEELVPRLDAVAMSSGTDRERQPHEAEEEEADPLGS
jgi:exonuclease VII small subunit